MLEKIDCRCSRGKAEGNIDSRGSTKLTAFPTSQSISILLISFLYVCIISTDEDPSLQIESSAIINLRGVSTKLNKYKYFIIYQESKKRKNKANFI